MNIEGLIDLLSSKDKDCHKIAESIIENYYPNWKLRLSYYTISCRYAEDLLMNHSFIDNNGKLIQIDYF